MMIAFISLHSRLVPLIEGLCISHLCGFDFSVSGSHYLRFLIGRNLHFKEEKQLLENLISPPSTYIHTCTLYTYTNTYMPRFSPPDHLILRALQLCCFDLWAHYRIPHVRCVCMCADTRTYTHVHSQPRQKYKHS